MFEQLTACMFVQLALEPLWKLYEVCNPGADVKTALGKAAKSLGLTQVNLLSGKINSLG